MAKKKKNSKYILLGVGLLLVIGSAIFIAITKAPSSVSLQDIHGIGYTQNGNEIIIASHDGLKEYKKGKWNEGTGEKHDYMGFSMVDNGFYSSGHPGAGSDKPNPLGVVKGDTNNDDINLLGLEGESDFHLLSAGYRSHALYVYTPAPNSKMDSAGIYYSLDEGRSWNKSNLEGISGEITGIAAHPTDPKTVAISTLDKVYISYNSGGEFKEVTKKTQITSIGFGPDGSLLVGGILRQAIFSKINLKDGSEEQISIPTLKEDALSFIAQSPTDSEKYVFSTFNKDVFLFNGERWLKIVDQGRATN
jgi:hypothetical protein